MENPKVSVLIPMYNKKQYIEQCVESALNQNFQDEYEVIVRDNCSTDGSYELVQEKYTEQIENGKLRLYRNDENLGLGGNTLKLIDDAKGKYFILLHNDDMILSHAVSHLYEVAEKTNADVVHESFFFNSPPDGIIKDFADCKITCNEKNTFEKVLIMPNDPHSRFKEWFNTGTFWDAQYNFYNKNFVIENEIFNDSHDYYYNALYWLMLSKVFVKTPIVCYVRRDNPYSGTRATYSPELLEGYMTDSIIVCKDFDKLFEKVELFKNNEYYQYMVKSHYIALVDFYQIRNRFIYQNGLTAELYEIASKVFKKHFGDDYFYPMMLYNWAHVMTFDQPVDNISLPES